MNSGFKIAIKLKRFYNNFHLCVTFFIISENVENQKPILSLKCEKKHGN